MSTWTIAIIIIVALAFIVSTITALKKAGGFEFPDSYEKKQDPYKDDDDDKSGLI